MLEYQKEISQIISKIQCRIIVYGNETPRSAMEYSRLIESTLQLGEISNKHLQIKTTKPKANSIIKLTNTKETNLAFCYYWPMGNRIRI